MIELSASLPGAHQVLLSVAILFFAGMIQGIFGLGFAMIATPILGLFSIIGLPLYSPQSRSGFWPRDTLPNVGVRCNHRPSQNVLVPRSFLAAS